MQSHYEAIRLDGRPAFNFRFLEAHATTGTYPVRFHQRSKQHSCAPQLVPTPIPQRNEKLLALRMITQRCAKQPRQDSRQPRPIAVLYRAKDARQRLENVVTRGRHELPRSLLPTATRRRSKPVSLGSFVRSFTANPQKPRCFSSPSLPLHLLCIPASAWPFTFLRPCDWV